MFENILTTILNFQVLTDLKQRLNNARPFVSPLEGIQQQYGMNTNLLKEIVEFWKTEYKWREREQFLNKYPQFKTNIQGLNIHFIHVKPKTTNNVKVLPLLLLHGWPGSVREFYEIIPKLTTPRKNQNFVFEVIVPSLPGYGFSDPAVRPGLGAAQMATVFNNLMSRLGFQKYYVQGGDWGSVVGASLATYYPDNVLGLHSNMCQGGQGPMAMLQLFIGTYIPSLVVDKEYQDRMYPLSEKIFQNILLESGYFHIQATKPDTVGKLFFQQIGSALLINIYFLIYLGLALNDSPVGLAAYIIEKFTTWTNPEWKTKLDGGLKLKYTYTDLLDNVMIYWVTGSITTSVRLYAETMNKSMNKFLE